MKIKKLRKITRKTEGVDLCRLIFLNLEYEKINNHNNNNTYKYRKIRLSCVKTDVNNWAGSWKIEWTKIDCMLLNSTGCRIVCFFESINKLPKQICRKKKKLVNVPECCSTGSRNRRLVIVAVVTTLSFMFFASFSTHSIWSRIRGFCSSIYYIKITSTTLTWITHRYPDAGVSTWIWKRSSYRTKIKYPLTMGQFLGVPGV